MSAVLGFVQGVAEFLPISSSGHLTLLQHFFGMEEPDNLFNILLHFATLLAVCVYYFQDVVEMVLEFFRAIGDMFSRHPSRGNPPEARRLVLLIIVGTLPLFVVMLVKDYVEALGSSPVFVSCALLATGCILFLSDRMGGGRKTARNATLKDVLLVGLAQGCATIPGLSRSGCTISAGMAVGFDRRFAVRYSFLLSLPAVLGATLLEVKDVIGAEGGLAEGVLPMYLVGMVIAGVVGYFSIRLVNLLASKGKFGAFAYYCWAAGIISLIAIFMGF
ncbi:undecaprenyl-diphosphate phosphatase [Pseudoflavonifractor phocaeensis]|nr:undecaprenyl-diphosphate phosphatase [Pseudoflavonifractor phocaeensis]